MVSLLSTMLRGALGVLAAVLLVAVTWTGYVKRDSLTSPDGLLGGVFSHDGATPAAAAPPAQDGSGQAPASAPAVTGESTPAAGSTEPK